MQAGVPCLRGGGGRGGREGEFGGCFNAPGRESVLFFQSVLPDLGSGLYLPYVWYIVFSGTNRPTSVCT